jgi:hypothetical protein
VPTVSASAVPPRTRFDPLPDVPTIGDAVPGYEASVWAGVGVSTPPEIIERQAIIMVVAVAIVASGLPLSSISGAGSGALGFFNHTIVF